MRFFITVIVTNWYDKDVDRYGKFPSSDPLPFGKSCMELMVLKFKWVPGS